jgi:glutathione peroxidase-family protein/uncharacterized protein (DUF2237 family)
MMLSKLYFIPLFIFVTLLLGINLASAGALEKGAAPMQDKNIFGQNLQLCCNDPKTGFYRNGYCQTGEQDVGTHVACAVVTDEFLNFTRVRGNDLSTPRPAYQFPGLKAGDKWCLCASRWVEALEAGVAPPLVLDATHEKMREYADLDVLKKYDHTRLSGSKKVIPQSRSGAYQFSFTSIDGAPMPLQDFAGKVMLIVNTASECGFTKQYHALQEIYTRYKDQGFVVIGVPCNQFGRQEPGSEKTIAQFVKDEFGVTFSLTSKVNVRGDDVHPFFAWAASQDTASFFSTAPKWNFHKYLIDQNGNFVASFGSQTAPDDPKITTAIERLLHQNQ